ncbi:hypothetical protein ACFWF3_11630 [Nocardia sp. NPDC060220]|uniref:hypothetical protein n=1 Tax=Nocardia sp. NPDC060220 TaxID=3347076 RepID=UPI003654C7B6
MVTEVLDRLGSAEIAAVAHSFGTDIPIDLAEAGRACAVVLIDQALDFRCATYSPGLITESRPSQIGIAQRAPAFAVRLGSRQGFAPGLRYASVPGFADVVVRDFRGFTPSVGRIALVDRARELAARPARVPRLIGAANVRGGQRDRRRRIAAAGERADILPNRGLRRSEKGGDENMRSKFCLPAVVLALVACGCSETVQGAAHPDSATPPATAFGVPVPAADKLTFDTLDRVRSVDPCGFVDRARVSAEGVVSLFGPTTQIDQCAIRFTPNGARNPSYLYLDLGHTPMAGNNEARQISGETISVEGPNTHGNCAFSVPLRFPLAPKASGQPDIVEVPTVAYAKVSSSGFDSAELGCRLGEQLAGDIVAAFRNDKIPLRSAALTPVSDIELLRHNPCEIVAAMPAQVPLTLLNAEFDPTRCSFMVDGPRELSEAASVSFDLTRRPLEPTSATNHLIDVGGVPVLISRDETIPPPTCVESFAVGPELDPSDGIGDTSGSRVQPIVRITSLCTITEQLRPAAMKLFGAVA